MNGFADLIAADARLAMLTALAKETDGSLTDHILTRVLDVAGIRRSRDFVRTQMRALAALGAVRLIESGEGTVMVAAITRAGRDHVERRGLIEGVTRPPEA